MSEFCDERALSDAERAIRAHSEALGIDADPKTAIQHALLSLMLYGGELGIDVANEIGEVRSRITRPRDPLLQRLYLDGQEWLQVQPRSTLNEVALPKDAQYKSRDGFDQKFDGAHAFIQWKGTDLCADFHCECGAHHHIDADFVYAVKCTCGAVYEMPHSVRLVRVDDKYDGCVHTCQDDES